MLRSELGIGGGMALAVRLRAGIDRRRAVLLELHDDVLALAPGGALDVGGEPDAAEAAGAGRLLLAALEAGPIGEFEPLRHMAVEIARVVGAIADRRRVGHLRGLDEVAAADLRLPEPGLAADPVDETLKEVGGLRAAGAAIGVDRHGVRVDAAHAHEDERRPIDPGHHGAAEVRDVGPELRQVGAEIAQNVEAHRQEAVLAVERNLADRDVVAPLRIALKMVAAVGDPFHGPVQAPSGFRGERVFAVHEALRAKAAADVAGDDAHLLRRHLQDLLRQRVAQAVHALARGRDREALGLRIEFGDDAAGLHEVRDQAVVLDGERDDPLRLCEGGIDGGLVAHGRIVRDVARGLAPDLGGAGRHRGADVADRRQDLVVDRDRLGGVAGLRQGFGDDEGDRIADMLGDVLCENRDVRHVARRAVPVRHRREARHVAEMGDVAGGEDKAHAGESPRGLKVADREAGMGVRAAQHEGRKAVFRPIIVRIATAAGEETLVFDAAQGLADSELGNVHRGLR